jgi:hypothetical protein
MVALNKESLIITCKGFDYEQYINVLRGLIATIQTAVTHPHYNGDIQNDVDFTIDLLLQMIPNEQQAKAMFKASDKATPQNLTA